MKINPDPTIDNVGGKGFQLLKLQEIGCVPSFFILSFDDYSEIDDAVTQNEILEYFEKCKFQLVSVRSSATTEDSFSASFAGMFSTVLNVGKNDLISSIKKVLDSVNDPRVKKYCELNKIDYTSVKMCVVIQQMLNSRVSGVCFTKESEKGKLIVIEACYGLGEALVSGLVSPDTYYIDRTSLEITSQNIGFQKVMYDNNSNRAPIPVPFHKRNAKKLSGLEILTIAQIALKIENELDYNAADIEWAYENNKLFLLQVRPFLGLSGG